MVDLSSVWKAYKETRGETYREQLIVGYLGLVKYLAGRLSVGALCGAEYDDLVGYGVIGLMDAIERFDPDKGNKFETYATSRIRGAMVDACRKNDWVPRTVRQRARELERAYSRVENSLGRSATDEEVAAELGITTDELARTLGDVSNTFLVSLDESASGQDGDESISLVDMLKDESESPDDIVANRSLVETLSKAIDLLPERERQVISLYYYDELTLKQIGEVLGVTESRVSQLHTKAILRLRGRLSRARSAHAV